MEKKKSLVRIYCTLCKGEIHYGRGWAHIVEGNKDFHMDCYLYGKEVKQGQMGMETNL